MIKEASLKKRITALLFDYLGILLYLILLFGISMGIYFSFFKGIPQFTHLTAQLLAFFTTVLPITVYCITKELGSGRATYGKRRVKLRVEYQGSRVTGSIVRNTLKFLPWQLAHLSVISGTYNGFESPVVIVFYGLSVTFPVIYIVMVWLRKDHKHIGDLLAKCSVVETS